MFNEERTVRMSKAMKLLMLEAAKGVFDVYKFRWNERNSEGERDRK